MDKAAVQVEHLRKVYGATVAVEDVSFAVHVGEIFGMVGPNGAGKTTTIECLEGLRRPDGGTVRVLGLDPQQDGYALRERIGIQLQHAALPHRLKVWEAMDLFASLYPRSLDWRALLDQLGLAEKANAPVAKLSGGQKHRLFIALALVNDPEIVFLDELTTGLDPQARRAMWDLSEGCPRQGENHFSHHSFHGRSGEVVRPGGNHRPRPHCNPGFPSQTGGKARCRAPGSLHHPG
jgi:ABC-2 type transport system ATP-binding protein